MTIPKRANPMQDLAVQAGVSDVPLKRCTVTGKGQRSKGQAVASCELHVYEHPDAPRLRPYRCEHCGYWHTTKKRHAGYRTETPAATR